MEAALKKTDSHTEYDSEPDLDRAEYWEFRLHFQQSILLSLLTAGSLTQNQYDLCVKKLQHKYMTTMP